MDNQEFIVPLNDADRAAKCAEQREPVVERKAASSDHPEHAALEVIECGRQGASLARGAGASAKAPEENDP